MATHAYMDGRKKYGRPQAILFADNPGSIDANEFYMPDGTEGTNFIILSDDNRQPIALDPTRIEQRKRTINGRMRSYYVGDKLTISTSWDMLPSKAFDRKPNFDSSTGLSTPPAYSYTSDGGAGGVDILDWYESHTGSFWVYLAYDKYTNFSQTNPYNRLDRYNQVIEVFFSNFKYSVTKRGATNHDYWNITLSLEEA
jgi:hypothetical protein